MVWLLSKLIWGSRTLLVAVPFLAATKLLDSSYPSDFYDRINGRFGWDLGSHCSSAVHSGSSPFCSDRQVSAAGGQHRLQILMMRMVKKFSQTASQSNSLRTLPRVVGWFDNSLYHGLGHLIWCDQIVSEGAMEEWRDKISSDHKRVSHLQPIRDSLNTVQVRIRQKKSHQVLHNF